MRYNEPEFKKAVEQYKKAIGKAKGKVFLVTFPLSNKAAFLSIAPLSRAIHELGADLNVSGFVKKSESLEALQDFWSTYERYKAGEMDETTDALKEFVKEAEKKAKGLEKFMKGPDFVLKAGKTGFEGSFEPKYNYKWFRPFLEKELKETAKKVWRDVYALKKGEKVSVGFVLVPTEENLGHPLQDYLDAYPLCWSLMEEIKGKYHVVMGASSSRASMRADPERISEIKATLMGCELSKNINEPVFKKFKELSNFLKLNRIKPGQASFFVAGKGYHGKHLFGETIGYPSPNGKTRWQSPGMMIYKLDFYAQTKNDPREPKARMGFTETIPLDIWVETCNISWKEMRDRNYKVKEVVDKAVKVIVKGKKTKFGTTDFEVGLVKQDGTRRWVRTSDTDVREIINSEYLKKTGIKAGTMANLPGGEAFMTPEYLKGTFVGDVVIAIDQSYRLSDKNPLVIRAFGDHYKIKSGPKDIIEKLNKRKKESWETLMEVEKNNSAPKEIIELRKKNFERIGEFAINTNPKARLCDYLIVNEKIARMIHIALGSGFEPDRAGDYHMDIVIDAPAQKLDIYGIDENGREHWILKKGQFVA